MIVYTGKQYGNEFNNGDEALFQDANRPRDEDKFKIRPGMQSDKWDWRGSNKNTDFSHIFIKGWTTCPGTGANKAVLWRVPKLQEKWTSSEIPNIPNIQLLGADYWQMERENNPFVVVKSGTITYLTGDGGTGTTTATANTSYFEIAESGLYYIMAYGTFYFDTNYYNSNYGYEYKERVGIAQPINGAFTNTDRTQSRAVGNGDNLRFMQIGWYAKGAQIVPLVGHSFTSGTTYVICGLSVVRLG